MAISLPLLSRFSLLLRGDASCIHNQREPYVFAAFCAPREGLARTKTYFMRRAVTLVKNPIHSRLLNHFFGPVQFLGSIGSHGQILIAKENCSSECSFLNPDHPASRETR